MEADRQRPAASPVLVLLVGILAVSTGSIFARYAQGYAPSLVVAAYRLGLATAIIAPLALLRYRHEISALRGRRLGLALLSGAFLALHFATWITSLEYTSVASSVVLVDTMPLWVALLSPFTIKEPIRSGAKAGILLAVAGGVVVGMSDSCVWSSGRLACPPLAEFVQGRAFTGNLLALAGAFMAACYILIGRSLRGSMSLVGYIFVVYGAAAVVLFGLAAAWGARLTGYPAPAYAWFLLAALVPQLLGHSAYNWALRYLPAATISVSLLGEPIGSALLALALFNETPTGMMLLGAGLILAGIYIASRNA